jgi:hypothetical protein
VVAAVSETAVPELAAARAETRALRDRYGNLLDRFAKGPAGWNARISQVHLAREYRDAGLQVPDGLKGFAS